MGKPTQGMRKHAAALEKKFSKGHRKPTAEDLVAPPEFGRCKGPMLDMRVSEVCDRIAKLHTTRQIQKDLAKIWDLTEDAVLRIYIRPAHHRLRAQYAADAPHAADRVRECLADLYQEAFQIGDFRTCSIVLDKLAKIDGSYAATTVNANLAGGSGVAVAIGPGNPEATRERMDELLDRPEIQERLAVFGLTKTK